MDYAPWRTVRGQLVLAALRVELVMLAILVGNSLRLLHEAMGAQAREQAEQIAPVLSAALVAPLAQYDYATVQAVLDESHAIRGIDYLAVSDATGAIVATSGWPRDKPLPAVDAYFTLDDDDNPPRYDLALPIRLAGQTLGTLQFGLDLTRILVARKNLLTQGVLIASSELLLSAGLLTLLGLLITRQLSLLTKASLKVAEGQLTPAPVPEGQDDVGRLGAAFNTMSRAIAERVDQLTRANEETARIALALQEKHAQLEQSHAALSAENGMRLEIQEELEDALERIRDRTAQLKAIFDLSPDGFVSFDAAHRVKYANPAFLRMTGAVYEEIIGLDEGAFATLLAHLCAEQARFPGVAALYLAQQEAAAGRNPQTLIELAGPGKRMLEVGVRESDAESVSQILYFRDVTHEIEVDRMKSEFLSTAAHELRTPMTSIYGFSELLSTQHFDEATQRELAQTIHRNADLMTSIINELLDLARIEEKRGKDFFIERLELRELLHKIVADLSTADGRRPPEEPRDRAAHWVRADREKLTQAVNNVLSNACKYSSPESPVRIELVESGGESVTPPRAGIRVIDQGIGMTPEQLAHVCERFYRAETSGRIPGTGLGMSIVKEIIELLGGSLEIVSALGVGTTVTLWLPSATAESRASGAG